MTLEEIGLGLRLAEIEDDREDLETRLEGLEPRTDDLELRLEDLDLGREIRLESRTELLRREEFKVGLGDRLEELLEGDRVRLPAGDFVLVGSGSGPESESELNLSRLFLFDDAGVSCEDVVLALALLLPSTSESESSEAMNSLLVGAFSVEFLIVASDLSEASSSSELSRKLALVVFFFFPADPDFGFALTEISSSSSSESSRSDSRFSFSSSPDKSLSTFFSFRRAFGVFRVFSADFFGSDFFPLFGFVADSGCARAGNIWAILEESK